MVRLAAAAVALLCVLAPSALAHPFGPPPTALLSVSGTDLVIRWRAAIDDHLALGERLGVLPPGSADRYREAAVQVAPPAEAEAALDQSPALADYLRQHIQVSQRGTRCDSQVVSAQDFVNQGAVTRHRCPELIGTVTVTFTMLLDLNPAYRTFALDRSDGVRPGQAVHTERQPAVRWDFSAITGAESDPDPRGADDGSRSALSRAEDHFVRLIDAPAPSAWVVLLGLLIALGIGAVHALGPGHGKAIAAAYLVSARASARDAWLLGAAVAAMHTASVLALGLILHLLASGGARTAQAGPWLSLLAAVVVLAVGLGSLTRVWRQRQGAVQAELAAGHDHDTPHTHDHVHQPELPPGVAPLSRRGLILIGLSGGLLPSPSAFLVLTTALFSGRTLFGLALLAAFSLGLALTLALLGLAVIHGRSVMTRRLAQRPRAQAALRALPLASALVITVAGLWWTVIAAANLA